MEILKSHPQLWELFTKKEEYAPEMLDKYQRFPFYASQHKNIFEPVVSDFLYQNGLKINYPDQRPFALCLTHDIDVIHFPKLILAQRLYKSLGQWKLGEFLKTALGRFNRKFNAVLNFNEIMNLEQKYEAKSTFFFLCLDKKNLDFNYKIEALSDEIGHIIKRGWEVGLQGGHEALDSINKMKKEKDKLEKISNTEIIGYRNHYMKFRVPTTWELLYEAGFHYDATFGYADCVGFRNGMCHPFKPFNLLTNRTIDILELSSHIADFTLFEYMKLDRERAWQIIKRLIQKVEKINGILAIQWHNTYLADDEMFKFYKRILSYCYKKNAWMTTGKEIWNWWRERGFI